MALKQVIVLAIKTNDPTAELAIYENRKLLAEEKWSAQGTLADTINIRVEKLLNKSNISLKAVEGIICFRGPGSFTGLRIGLSVANALAYTQDIPIVATKGENWLEKGIKDLLAGKNQKLVTPFYDRPANITTPKK